MRSHGGELGELLRGFSKSWIWFDSGTTSESDLFSWRATVEPNCNFFSARQKHDFCTGPKHTEYNIRRSQQHHSPVFFISFLNSSKNFVWANQIFHLYINLTFILRSPLINKCHKIYYLYYLKLFHIYQNVNECSFWTNKIRQARKFHIMLSSLSFRMICRRRVWFEAQFRRVLKMSAHFSAISKILQVLNRLLCIIWKHAIFQLSVTPHLDLWYRFVIFFFCKKSLLQRTPEPAMCNAKVENLLGFYTITTTAFPTIKEYNANLYYFVVMLLLYFFHPCQGEVLIKTVCYDVVLWSVFHIS